MKKIFLLTLLIVGGWYSVGLSSLLQADREKHLPLLRIRLRSSVRSKAQLFFDIRSDNFVTSRVSAGDKWVDCDFPLPPASITSLRFDPLMTNGEMTIQSAEVIDYRHQVLRHLPVQDFVSLNQIQSLQVTPAGLQIVTQNPAPDPRLGITLNQPLDLSNQGLPTVAAWGRIVGWHSMTLFLVLGVLIGLAKLIRRHTRDAFLEFSLLPGKGLERFPLELYVYVAAAVTVLLVEISNLEQTIFRLL